MGFELTGEHAEDAVISSIPVDPSKPTYVFYGTPSGEKVQAIDMSDLRLAVAKHSGGVKVRSYLATFRLEPTPGAPSEFTVSVQTTGETAVYNPNSCQTVPPLVIEDFVFE